MKKALALLLVVVLLFGMMACENKDELRKIVINEVTRSVFYAPLYAGITKGFFEEEGLDIEIVTGGGSDKSMTALLAGEAEISLMGPETGVYVINEGKQEHPVIIGQLTKRDGSFLVGREKSENFTWEELRNKSVIGGRPGGMPYMTLLYVLEKNGLKVGSDVEVINNVQFNLMGGAFEGGTGDYVTLFEPTASQFEDAGKGYIVANIGLESGEVPYTAFMVMPETVKKDAKMVEAFIRALYKAQQWVWSASDEEIGEAMQPFFPDTDVETLALVAKSYRETDSWTKNPVMTEDSFTRLQDIMDGAGELADRVEFEKLVDNSFAQKAVQNSK